MASDHGDPSLPDCGDAIDASTFEQILEMDDDDEKEFSRGIVFGFFEQADNTFVSMQKAIDDKNLAELSSLGHFLKGSSATLGLTKVKDGCEKVQNYGARRTATGEDEFDSEDKYLKKIKDLLPVIKSDYEDAQKRLKAFYGDAEP